MSIHNTENIDGNLDIQNALNVGGNAEIASNMTVRHNLIVEGWLLADNVKWPNVGLFDSVNALMAAYSDTEGALIEPKPGWTAGVIEGSTVMLYYYKVEGGWTNSGLPMSAYIGGNSSDVTGLATRAYVDEALSLKADASALTSKANTSDVYNKTQVRQYISNTVEDVVRVVYEFADAGNYTLCNKEHVVLMIVDGVVTEEANIDVDSGTVIEVKYIFDTPDKIPSGVFTDNANIREVYFPSWIKTIGEQAFYGCSGINCIECHSMTPPVVLEDAFGGMESDVSVYVHEIVMQLYQASDGWASFTLGTI